MTLANPVKKPVAIIAMAGAAMFLGASALAGDHPPDSLVAAMPKSPLTSDMCQPLELAKDLVHSAWVKTTSGMHLTFPATPKVPSIHMNFPQPTQ